MANTYKGLNDYWLDPANARGITDAQLSVLAQSEQAQALARARQYQLANDFAAQAQMQGPSAAPAVMQAGLGNVQQQQQAAMAGSTGNPLAAQARALSAGAQAQQAAIAQGGSVALQDAVANRQTQLGAMEARGQAYGDIRAGNINQYGQNVQGQLVSQQLSQQGNSANLGAALDAYGIKQQAGIQKQKDDLAMAGAAMNTVASMTKLSDRRLKDNIQSGDGAVESYLDNVRPYTYNYTGSSAPQLSPMAQDLERSQLGRQAVVQDFDMQEFNRLRSRPDPELAEFNRLRARPDNSDSPRAPSEQAERRAIAQAAAEGRLDRVLANPNRSANELVAANKAWRPASLDMGEDTRPQAALAQHQAMAVIDRRNIPRDMGELAPMVVSAPAPGQGRGDMRLVGQQEQELTPMVVNVPERSPMLAQATPADTKWVDYGRLAPVLAAAQGNLHERLKRLEDGRSR